VQRKMALFLIVLPTMMCGADRNATREDAAAPLVRMRIAQLAVTRGTVAELPSGKLAIRDAKVRFVAPGTVNAASMVFTYDGPTPTVAPLESGAMREQLGLKLRAQDGCNLLYVMWRLRPVNEIVVSTKNNPGRTTSAQCGAHGYTVLSPMQRGPLPVVTVGSTHALGAAIDHGLLIVRVDGSVVWDGPLTAQALANDGPTGARTDNVAGALEFSGAPGVPTGAPASYLGED